MGQVGRGQTKESFVNEHKPVDVWPGVQRWPVDGGVKCAVMCSERGVGSKADGGVVNDIQLSSVPLAADL